MARDEHLAAIAINPMDDTHPLPSNQNAIDCLQIADIREDAARSAHLRALETAREVQAHMHIRKKAMHAALERSGGSISRERHATRFGHFGASREWKRETDPSQRRLPLTPECSRCWNDLNRPSG